MSCPGSHGIQPNVIGPWLNAQVNEGRQQAQDPCALLKAAAKYGYLNIAKSCSVLQMHAFIDAAVTILLELSVWHAGYITIHKGRD